MIDFKELLIKYMKFIMSIEGMSFIGFHSHEVEFTDEEEIELEKIEEYIENEFNKN